MTKTMYQNEQKKREFLEYLKGAKGFSESSLNSFAEAIDQWQIFTGKEDFASFNKSKALAFCNWLKTREAKTESGTISLTTQDNYLRRIKKFFSWLAMQPDYKNKIKESEVEYLRLSKGDAQIARQGTTRKTPTLDEVKVIIESIKIKNEIDLRDRAMISFALITGARISAIASLKMKNFDIEKKIIDQNPVDDVKTKNSKRIVTTFFPIGWNKPKEYFLDWYKHLKDKGFSQNDPIFPATLNNAIFEKSKSNKNVSNRFWSDANGARKAFEKRCKNAELHYFNPHSFRHLIVSTLSKIRLTEEEKKAVSLNLGHANIGTTFGSYGYGGMTPEEAVKIVEKIDYTRNNLGLTDDEMDQLKGLVNKLCLK